MRHPFDGLNQPNVQPVQAAASQPEGLTRRSALEKMVFAAAGFVAVPAALRAQNAERLRLDAASIAVPTGDRPDSRASSAARMGEGLHHVRRCSAARP